MMSVKHGCLHLLWRMTFGGEMRIKANTEGQKTKQRIKGMYTYIIITLSIAIRF